MLRDFEFGGWTARPSRLILERNGEVVHTKPKTMDVLVALAERPGDVLGRDELLKQVWQNAYVSDDVLTQAIAELRRALRDEFRQPLFVETVPRRGYRLIPAVDFLSGDRPHPPASDPDRDDPGPGADRRSPRLVARGAIGLAVLVLLAWIAARTRAAHTGGTTPETRSQIASAPRVSATLPTSNTEAYELYLKARQKFRPYQPTSTSMDEALSLARQAEARDPKFAEAHALVAEIQTFRGFWNQGPREDILIEARQAAKAALALDPGLSYPHAVSGLATAVLDWKWEDGYREAVLATGLDPDDERSLSLRAILSLTRGRPSEAVRLAYRAYELAPIDTHALGALSWVLYQARQYDRAAEFMGKTLDVDPDALVAKRFRPLAFAHAGRYEEALAAERALSPGPSAVAAGENLGLIFVLAGREEEARALLAKAPPRALAQTRARLGDKEALLQKLERLEREHATSYLMWLRTGPAWDPIRNEPRFERVLVRVGLVG